MHFFPKKGIATYIIEELLPKLHPTCRRYELLTRHQNDIALFSYMRLGFQVGDIELVQKHGYNPLYYMGLYKER
jgi:ribosomal protein S18 acetylase RimI-like enzyme